MPTACAHGSMPERLLRDLDRIAVTARRGEGRRAAAHALMLAADLTVDEGLRARRLRLAAIDAQLAGDEPLARKLLAAADEAGADEASAGSRVPAAWALATAGRAAPARTTVAPALAEARALGSVRLLPAALAASAFVELQAGRLDEALTLAGEAVLLAGLAEEVGEARRALLVLATAQAIRGTTPREPDPASLDLLDLGAGRCADVVTRHRGDWSADQLEAHLRTGWRPDRDLAQELVRRARAAADPLPAAIAARSVGLIAPEERYAGWFTAALRRHAGTGCPFELARTHLAFGERLRRSGLRVRARPELLAAIADFDRLGAVAWAERARSELAATAAVRGGDAGPLGLTPQESQVARAVATGRTNREVAAALFLSRKTVEFHLGNIYRKLGLRNRTQLAQHYHEAA